jgi:hypothetical protein
MQNLGCTHPDSIKDQYQKNTSQDFLRIWQEEASTYRRGYVVQYPHLKDQMSGLEKVYENEGYAVFALPTFQYSAAQ